MHDLLSITTELRLAKKSVESWLLSLAQGRRTTQHVDHKEIEHAISIDIRHVNPHGAGRTHTPAEIIDGIKTAFSIVDPQTIRCPIIVADIEIRRQITVHVPKGDTQPPIPGQ